MKVALFTNTYDEVNGVGNTFRYLTAYCRETGRELDVYAHASDGRASADIFVFPSTSDTFGNVVQEALSSARQRPGIRFDQELGSSAREVVRTLSHDCSARARRAELIRTQPQKYT